MIAAIRTLSQAVSSELFGFVSVKNNILNKYSSSYYQYSNETLINIMVTT